MINFCDDGQSQASNLFVAAVMDKVNNVSKKSLYKLPVEYRQAVQHYIANTKMCFLAMDKSKLLSYEIELNYLFDNYRRFSTITLLSRLRSAHQEMVKNIIDVHSEKYQYYEQICSALLLQCGQMLSDNAHKQLLDALHEIDDLIVYWRYQKNHPLKYCFGKSPVKWIMGKSQEKEIQDNIKCLESKQAELYVVVGRLTAHEHLFTECEVAYADCYAWIEELLSVLSCIKTSSGKRTDGTQFDIIAAQLELKLKYVSFLKYDSLYSIISAKKSNHFVRHWIGYTIALAVTGYITRYYVHNYGAVNKLLSDGSSSLHNSLYGWVIEPSHSVWNTVFSKVPESDVKNSVITDIKKNIETLETKQGVNKATSENLNNCLKTDHTNTQKTMKELLDKWIQDKKVFGSGTTKNPYYTLDEQAYNKIINSELVGDVEPFQKLVYDMPVGLIKDLIFNDDFIKSLVIFAELKIYHYGSSIISIVFELIVEYGISVVKEILNVLAHGNPELVAKVNLILNVAILAPTVLIGCTGINGLYKTYRWATKRNYSPIRIALTDVNSLLIESPMPLDDYDYGKLVYLVYKLRNKARSLKDALCNEFLADITKLESKRFDVAAKRGIIDNMFNKYAFLGRITV